MSMTVAVRVLPGWVCACWGGCWGILGGCAHACEPFRVQVMCNRRILQALCTKWGGCRGTPRGACAYEPLRLQVICYGMEVTNWCKGIGRLMNRVPRVQHNAGLLEQWTVQDETLIFTALATYIALIEPAGSKVVRPV